MTSSSVSFRISRSAEDLAGTLHLLSQRLVRLEQRLEALEGQGQAARQEDPAMEESLGNAERLLLDCRALLEGALDPDAGSGPDADGIAAMLADPELASAEQDSEARFQEEGAGDAEPEISLISNGAINSAAA